MIIYPKDNIYLLIVLNYSGYLNLNLALFVLRFIFFFDFVDLLSARLSKITIQAKNTMKL